VELQLRRQINSLALLNQPIELTAKRKKKNKQQKRKLKSSEENTRTTHKNQSFE
jgi:hypothetical protein